MGEFVSRDVAELLRKPVAMDPDLAMLEAAAKRRGIPVTRPEVGHFLYVLATMLKPSRVLEIGTAVGYSTLWLARAVTKWGGHITTIEVDADRAEEARGNFTRAGVASCIRVIVDDALKALPALAGPYYLIFLDAAKGQYPALFELCMPLLAPGGVLVADNLFLHGLASGMEDVPRRHRTMVSRLNSYLDIAIRHPALATAVLPLGDGLAVSVHKGGEDGEETGTAGAGGKS